MIRMEKLPENLKTAAWDTQIEDDEEAKTWIWNQLMGETKKGDTLEFQVLYRGEFDSPYLEEVFAGALKREDGSLKGIVPAIYEKVTDGILEQTKYAGQVIRDDLNVNDGAEKSIKQEVDMDVIASAFLAS